MVTLFHEIEVDERADALRRGLLQGEGASKRGAVINKTDEFLRAFQPEHLVRAGIDRQANIFCYLTRGQQVIDATTGNVRGPAAIARDHARLMLQVEVDERRCYVGDLDVYDQIRDLLIAGELAKARQLALVYWRHVVPFAEYAGQLRRPEALVTYDISPANLSMVEQ